MTAFEDFVTGQVITESSVIGLYPATADETRANFDEWRKRTGR